MREGFLQWFKWFELFYWFTDDISRSASMLNRLHELQAMDDDDDGRAEAYIKAGGTAALMGNMISEYALKVDTMVGNGEHAEKYAEILDELPTCRNDHEFGFVSGMCGYMRRIYHAKLIRPNREAQAQEKALGGRITMIAKLAELGGGWNPLRREGKGKEMCLLCVLGVLIANWLGRRCHSKK